MRKLSPEGKGTHFIYSDVKFVLVIQIRNNQDECEADRRTLSYAATQQEGRPSDA